MTNSTWADKLAKTKGLPKKVKKGKKKMIVPAPKDVDKIMKKVRKGKLITVSNILQTLSKKYKTDTCCQLTTGVFVWIAANSAHDALQNGKKVVTPYWRTIKTDGSLNPKYPGGEGAQAKKLTIEGHKVVRKGKRMVVLNYKNKLQKL